MTRARRWVDLIFRNLALTVTGGIVALFVVLGLVMYEGAGPAIREFGREFLTTTNWDPVADHFGGLAFIYGTLVTSLLALFIAVPISLGAAIFLSEFCPRWMRLPISYMIELLAAIPSVVYGLWGIFVLVPWVRTEVQGPLKAAFGFLPLFSGPALGIGTLAAAIILAIMITPTITAVANEVIKTVPESLREAALALGSTRWETTWKVVLPFGRTGILGGALLGLGRAVGETMAVTMVVGNRAQISPSLFAPASTMASIIASEFNEAVTELHIAALIEVGLLLFGVTLALNVAARLLVWSVSRRTRGG